MRARFHRNSFELRTREVPVPLKRRGPRNIFQVELKV